MKTSREDIIARAFPVFLVHGYEATSMADLVSASGLSKGAFYYYFNDKASLFEACIDTFFTAYISGAEGNASDGGEVIDAGVAGFIKRLADGYAAALLEARRLCGDASAYTRFVLSVVPLRRAGLLEQMAGGMAHIVNLYLDEYPESDREKALLFAEQSIALIEGIGVLAALHNDADPARRFQTLLDHYLKTAV